MIGFSIFFLLFFKHEAEEYKSVAKTRHLIFPFSLRSSSSPTSSEARRARFGGWSEKPQLIRSQREGVKVEDWLPFLSPFLFIWSWGRDPGLKIKSDWGSVNFGPSANGTTSFSLPHHWPCLLSHHQALLFNDVCSGFCVTMSQQGFFPSYPLGWGTGRGSDFKFKHFCSLLTVSAVCWSSQAWTFPVFPLLGHFLSSHWWHFVREPYSSRHGVSYRPTSIALFPGVSSPTAHLSLLLFAVQLYCRLTYHHKIRGE